MTGDLGEDYVVKISLEEAVDIRVWETQNSRFSFNPQQFQKKPTLPGDSFRQTPGKAVVLPKSEHGHYIASRLCELHVTDFSPEMPCVYPSPFPELLDD